MAAAEPQVLVGLYGDSHVNYLVQADFGTDIRLLTFERARGRDFFITMSDHPTRLSAIFDNPTYSNIVAFLTSYPGNDLIYPSVSVQGIFLGYLNILSSLKTYYTFPFSSPSSQGPILPRGGT